MLTEVEIEKCIVPINSDIIQAVKVINSNNARTAIVIDTDGKAIGTITDGDVRRHIVNDGFLTDSVSIIMNKNFIYADVEMSNSHFVAMMRENNIRQIPVLNKSKELVKQYIYTNLFQYGKALDNTVVIMAGGKGTRLRPETLSNPKPLIKIDNVPMIEIVINNCKEYGFNKFIISVNYLKEQIIEFLGDGKRLDISIEYIEEEKPLGTAGALSLISKKLDKPFLMLNADVLTKVDFEQLLQHHVSQGSDLTLCTRHHLISIPFGVIELENGLVTKIKEKPELSSNVNAGIYFVEPGVIEEIEYNTYLDMPDLVNVLLSKNKQVSAFPIHEYWIDVGQHNNLAQAREQWSKI